MPSRAETAPWRFEAIGTHWRIDAPAGIGQDARAAVAERIDRYDRVWSRFRDDSLVRRIAAGATAAGTAADHDGLFADPEAFGGASWPLPPEAAELLGLYEQLYAVTEGRMSPLVGASLERLGYDRAYRLAPAGDPLPAPSWEDALRIARTDDGLRLDAPSPVLLDVGAAGKGHLVDLVGDVLLEHDVAGAVVDASGDIRHWGDAPMRIALENPANPAKAVGIAELAPGRALCASAVTRRAWGEGLHHIVDAVTGRPVADGLIGTFVVADSALIADGLATALFVTEPDRLSERWAMDWVRVFADGRLEASAGWEGELFA